ncbi:MAG: UvrD-helicase domain-containing protein [Oscillospiraceae bacterium]|nr:UvrD-helicase domain-containing protein [Oscillospiraceae bacterium]
MANKLDFTGAKRKALEKYFGKLNDMQKKAVFTVRGPVLILAGAGSGKTSVLVNRIANMVRFGNAYADETCPADISADDIKFLSEYNGSHDEDTVSRLAELAAVDKVNPWNILAITFTNKAAGELKSRLSEMLGSDGDNICAATFHSACVRILRREIDKLGYYTSDFAIYDSDDSQRLLKSCYEPLDLSDKAFPPKTVLGVISSAKDKLVSPEEFEEQSKGDYRKAGIAKLYKLYQNRMRDANALDFDDIIRLTVELFETQADVLDHYRNLYKYIMVDEYQDTNRAQFRLVSLLSEGHKNLCVVGDDDQSIYRFRGATIENILSFEEQFENASVIRLEQNYRSTQNILNAANSVIANNTARKEKKLWTSAKGGEKITRFKSNDESSESAFVAKTIKDGVENGGSYSDYAVLYRMNAQSNSLERAFTNAGIPYRVIGGMRFYDRKEIKDITAYLSVLNNNRDMLRFRRIINEPKRGIGDTTLSMIEQISDDLKLSPIEIMRDSEEYAPIAKKSALLKKTADMFLHLSELAETEPLDSLLDILLDKTGYANAMKALGDEGIGRMENINELKTTMVKYMEENGEDASLTGFLEEISLYTDADRMADSDNAVSMMTMHSAKGLEFPTVFIVGMEEGIFPGNRSLDSLEDLEEERRLAYVAITRAKEKLYITHAKQRMLFGSTNRNLISRFAKEIGAEYVEKIDSTVKTADDSGSMIVQSTPKYSLKSELANRKADQTKKNASAVDFSTGERVKHNVFGEGTVLSVKKISNDAMLEIAFDSVGTKKLMANYAKITKIAGKPPQADSTPTDRK